MSVKHPSADDERSAKEQAGNQGTSEEPPEDEPERHLPLSRSLKWLRVLAVGTGLAIALWTWQTTDPLEVVASSYGDFPAEWAVRGRILNDGDAVQGAVVWAVAVDSYGNRYSPASTKSDDSGGFEIRSANPNPPAGSAKNLPLTLDQILVRARAEKTVFFVPRRLSGRALLIRDAPTRLIEPITMWWGLAVLIAFGLSLLLAATDLMTVKWKYNVTLGLTLAVVAMIVLVFTRAHSELTSQLNAEELVRTLGFVNIFKGTYVVDGEPEWLVSLTAPPSATTSKGTASSTTTSGETTVSNTAPSESRQIVTGFGAPLWTLVMSIAGAALFTVALVVKEIRKPPSFEDHAKVKAPDKSDARERLQGFVEHQLFMLFAPFGGMFVYQALVLADAANKPITVGVAALGSGITLNLLLSWASNAAGEALGNDQETAEGHARGRT